MRVLISAEGKHDPAGQHLMQVDGQLMLIDLSGVVGTLVDPVITRVEWGPGARPDRPPEYGQIIRRDGHKQEFFDRSLLEPYLTAFHDRAAHLAQEQVAYQQAEAQAIVDRLDLEAVSDGFTPAPSDDEAFGPVVQPA